MVGEGFASAFVENILFFTDPRVGGGTNGLPVKGLDIHGFHPESPV